jgi:hypothetical protein
MNRRCLWVIFLTTWQLIAVTGARADEHSVRITDQTLRVATTGSLLVTATLGTFVALNQPTLLSDGRCHTGDPVFGDYGCHALSGLHGVFALLSIVLYTSTQAFEFAHSDWPSQNEHGPGFKALSYIHLIGMAIQPIGGLLAVVPQIVGAPKDGLFARVLRTLHIFLGYTILTTFAITTAIEL